MQSSRIPVSILKPLKGLDDELEANLESFCHQTHPHYEIIFGVADRLDPALAVARKVAAAHPKVASRIVVGECPTGLNPKVRLLRALLRSARYDAILISDSNVRVGEHYLATTAAELEDPTVGLVSNPIIGTGASTLGSALDNLQLNSYVIFGLTLANFIGRFACVVGKSMLLRRSSLQRIGGLGRFADVLAEDYLIGRAMRELGIGVVTCPSAIHTINKSWSLRKTWQRHLRWSQIRRSLGTPGYLLELLLLPHLWLAATVGSLLMNPSRWSASALSSCVCVYILLCLSETVATVRWSEQGSGGISLLPFAALRQFGQIALWLLAWGKSEVDWRGKKLNIAKGSKLIDRSRNAPRLSVPFARQAA